MTTGAHSHPQLLQAERDWNIVDLGAALANATYHALERQGIADEDNLFTGMFDRRGNGRRAYVRFKKDVLPRVNGYNEPFVRLVALSREFRQEPSWSVDWRDVVPFAFLGYVLTARLLDPIAEQLDELLDNLDLTDVQLAEAVSGALYDVPDTVGLPPVDEDDTSTA